MEWGKVWRERVPDKNLVPGVRPGQGREVRNEKKVPKVFSASNRVLRSYSALLMILSFDIVFAYGHIYDGKRRE